MQNLCFGPKCTISGYQSCEASILVHWTQNDVWKSFGAFRKPRQVKEEKLVFRARKEYFEVPKL
jgi:hypothetical protein